MKYSYFSPKIEFDISCKLPPILHEMSNPILFWGKSKKNIVNLSLPIVLQLKTVDACCFKFELWPSQHCYGLVKPFSSPTHFFP